MWSHRTHFLRVDDNRGRLFGARLQPYDSLYGSYALLQNLNFFVFGILMVAFAIGLRQGLPASRVMTKSLGLFGVMFFLLGFFPDEPVPWPAAAHYLISWVRWRFDFS